MKTMADITLTYYAVASFDSGDEAVKAELSLGGEDVPGIMLGKDLRHAFLKTRGHCMGTVKRCMLKWITQPCFIKVWMIASGEVLGGDAGLLQGLPEELRQPPSGDVAPTVMSQVEKLFYYRNTHGKTFNEVSYLQFVIT